MSERHPAAIPFFFIVALSLVASPAGARYPRVARDSQGSWIAADEALIRVVGELFSFYGQGDGLPSDRVRMVAPDQREVWAATPLGLGRMDRNSRRWEVFRAPDPLPSNDVYGVAVDDRFVWVGTAKGVAIWDKLGKEWTRVATNQGPGEKPVYEIVSLGKTVWFAGDQEVYRFDRQTGQWQTYGPDEGFTVGAISEIIQFGENMWFLGERGLARFDMRSSAVATFSEKDGLPSPLITAFAQVAGEIWIGTDRGLVVYQPGSDAISPFLYGKGMPEGEVVGIEVAMPYVWVATDRGLGQFNTMTKVWEEKREEDGLAPGVIQGLSLAGSMLVVIQEGSFQGYQAQRDDWLTFPIDDVWEGKVGAKADSSDWRFNFELIASGEGRLTTAGDGLDHSEQFVPDLRLGVGTVLDGGRSLDSSVRLDFGDATTSGIREYDAELRFRGNEDDTLRELLLSDELRLRDREDQHDLVDDVWLEGLGVYQRLGDSTGRKEDPVSVEAETGLRRGVRKREFFRGSIEYTYQLAQPYVTPRSEVVKVDGVILDRDVDYIITHTTGQLTFLNPDRVNALSLIDITYTYEQIPRKDTASQSILEMLPWDNELGGFTRSGSPVYVSDEGGLYAQINGAAPKYLDRGWMESVFQDYIQGSTSLSLQIHDMGSPDNALEILDYDRPISYVVLWDEPDSTALLDESLPSSYAVKMRMDRFYVELSIDEKSKSAEILIGLFAQAVRTKGDLSGTVLSSLRPIAGRVHLGVSPLDSFGIGASFLGASDLEDAEVMTRTGVARKTLEMGMVDLWTRHQLGGGDWGGELSSFFQAARSSSQLGADASMEGWGGSGDLVYNAPALNIRVDGEIHSRNFDAFSTRETPLGTFAGDVRADATLQPVRWLRLRLLYDHERSYLADELSPDGTGQGINENLIGKLTFLRAKWPTVWLLAGRSVLKGGPHEDEKLRLAGSLEYDLAHGLLDGLGLKKLAVKAYFDHSENQVPIRIEEHSPILDPTGRERWLLLGSAPGTAQNMRFELKFAPTATEDAYARFERKTFEPELPEGGITGTEDTGLPLEAWELIMGAASRWLPGIVPTFNGKMTYREGRELSGDDFQNAQAILAGQVELFPGRWLEALGSTMLSVGYGFTNAEESEGQVAGSQLRWIKTIHLEKDQVEAKGSYGNYDDVFRIENRSKWWTVREDETQTETERYFEVLNRLTFRPIYTSPITLRLDYAQLERRNPLDDGMGQVRGFSPSLEWEKRWSHDLVTKIRVEVPWRVLDGAWDEIREIEQNYQEWSIKPWLEIRLRLRDLWAESMLRLALRAYHQWLRPFDIPEGGDSGAETARELSAGLWLDWDRPGNFLIRVGVIYVWHHCEDLDVSDVVASEECRSQHAVQPTLKAIVRF